MTILIKNIDEKFLKETSKMAEKNSLTQKELSARFYGIAVKMLSDPLTASQASNYCKAIKDNYGNINAVFSHVRTAFKAILANNFVYINETKSQKLTLSELLNSDYSLNYISTIYRNRFNVCPVTGEIGENIAKPLDGTKEPLPAATVKAQALAKSNPDAPVMENKKEFGLQNLQNIKQDILNLNENDFNELLQFISELQIEKIAIAA